MHDTTGYPEVARAIRAWDAASPEPVVPTDLPCEPGVACIEVDAGVLPGNLGGYYWTGLVLPAHTRWCTARINTTPAVVPSPDWRVDVALHEIGHCLGLAHDDTTPSVMDHEWAGLNAPTPADREALQALYG